MSREAELNEADEKTFAYLKEHPKGVLQSDLWKAIEVDSRTCSRILKKLEDAGLIAREETKKDGTRTYLITVVHTSQAVDPSLLMAGEYIVPCVACDEECTVEHCKMLEDWIYELVFDELE
ncbi:transcriptional regulator, TrmB [Methanocorpusculum labreanum Z]|uniref:Transcriptional regulator, TrmB n=1 Tax=Methanocorpusculum labreanum (strain ATCC 43576 / DSM 4855 / Z) TaxID=410358 RepID=A2SQ94_METLZ|nr:MarR family transcriptional regulator [Methanocorpusculum labreanum]ABN06500.1 transcriptional regulator, TrmB [Methanocorpusculum labreanum Z]